MVILNSSTREKKTPANFIKIENHLHVTNSVNVMIGTDPLSDTLTSDLPTVSVILPTYDRPQRLRNSLSSISRQAYDNLEVVIVDSGDYQQTARAISDIQQKSGRLSIRHISQPPKGLGAARNLGISKAMGEYIAFIDDDEVWHPRKTINQITKLRSAGPEFGMIYGGSHIRFIHGSRLYTRLPKHEGNIYEDLLVRNEIGNISSVILEADVIEHVGGFDNRLEIVEDWDLFIRVAKDYKITFVKEAFTTKTLGNDTLMRNVENWAKYRKMVLDKYQDELTSRKLLTKAKAARHKDIGKQHCLNGDIREARSNFSKSFSISPEIGTVVLYIISLSGALGFRTAARLSSLPSYIRNKRMAT